LARPRTTTPTKPDDPRTHRSLEALRSAFLELIETKSIEQISIKEITEVAGLSYPTFFRRFGCKEELLEDIATEEVKKLLSFGEAALGRRQPGQASRDMCNYVNSRRKLWSVLLTGGAASVMHREFIRISNEIAESRPRISPWLPADLGPAFVTAGIFEILAWWLRQGEDYPIENVIALFDALVIEPVSLRRDIRMVQSNSSKSSIDSQESSNSKRHG
jgi:AcrR family transcriptional regulator